MLSSVYVGFRTVIVVAYGFRTVVEFENGFCTLLSRLSASFRAVLMV